LQGIALYQNNLAGWDLSGQDLVTADLQLSNLAGADLGGADLRQANLHSTNLTDANLSGANLARAFLWRSTFNRANVAGAIIHEADLREATLRGFTKEHLYSTGSYQAKVLRLIKFGTSNFAGWDFSGQDLLGVSFYASNLTESNLAGANLLAAAMSGANLSRSMLTNANLDLAMLSLANLTHAKLSGATLDRTDLSWADLRLVEGFDPVESTILTNTILPDGTVDGLQLSAFQTLRATAGVPLPLRFIGEFALVPNATIELNDNVAIVDYPGDTPVDTVRQRILAGRGGPGWGATWNGRGITSSTAATANSTDAESRSVGYAENTALPLGPYIAFDGVPVDGSSVLIAYTRTADANLDGVVSDDDVTILSAFYAPGVANPN
jgi:uncharacterized protein YjbI with pentapeptide repeats